MKIVSFLVIASAAAHRPACLTPGQVVDGPIWEDTVAPEFSSNWDVQYFDTYKIVSNLASNYTYLLYQCGSEPPAGVEADGVFEIPLQNVGITQTPMITYLEQIGARSEIAAFLTDPDFISSPCFYDDVTSGEVAVFVEGTDSTEPSLNGKATLSIQDTVAFDGPFGTVPFDNKIIVTEYLEQTNVGYFEWVKFFSTFFNEEETANRVAMAAKDRFDCIAENAQQAATADATTPPVVLWAYYSPFCQGWDIAKCSGNYYCEYADACGAQMLTSTEGSTEVCGVPMMSTEDFVEFGKDADYFIFPSPDWDSTYELFKDQLDTMKSVQNDQVYDYQGSGSNAWFEQRIAEYYHVLQDFCHVVGTTNPLNGRKWFRNVMTEEIGTRLDQCTDDTASNILEDNVVCLPGGTGAFVMEGSSATTAVVASSLVLSVLLSIVVMVW